MPSYTEVPLYTNREGGEPAGVLMHAEHWLLGTAEHCCIVLALVALAARAMRSRQLHWSWAALVCAVAVVARGPLGGWALPLAAGALLTSTRSRRWHREDLAAGGDLAAVARARTRPHDTLQALARKELARLAEHAGAQASQSDGALRVGFDERARPVSIPFAGAGGGTHTLVVGATGSGKTVTQSAIAVQAIERGMGAVVIDPKGDGDLREHLRRGALAAGVRFLEWTPDGSLVYNPFARGDAGEIADKALAGERFTEPHYQRQAQRYLGHAVRTLRHTGTPVSLSAIVAALQPEHLEQLARKLPQEQAHSVFAYLDALSPRQRSELSGVRDRLAILAESDVGRWLDPSGAGAVQFDLLSAVRSRAVVYFSLRSDSRPLLSQMLGAAIVQDLQTTVASLQRSPVPTLVMIDEFSAIAAEQVVRLFGRARSAAFSLLLGTQELCDLRLPGDERVLERVLGNLSVLIAHRQVVPGSAELISGVAGRRGTWKRTHHSDGRSTRVRGQEPVLDGARVTSLGRGWAAVLVLSSPKSARIARITAPVPPRERP